MAFDRVTLTTASNIDLVGHAWREYPAECCGLLIRGDSPFLVTATVEIPNIAPVPHMSFEMCAKSFVQAVQTHGSRIIGTYHSHPNTETVPSRRDMEYMFLATLPMVIIGLRKGVPTLRTYYFDSDGRRVVDAEGVTVYEFPAKVPTAPC